MSQPELRLVKEISLDQGRGRVSLDVGTTLLFPEEIVLSAREGDYNRQHCLCWTARGI